MAEISKGRVAFAIATVIVVILAVWRRHENHAPRDAKEIVAQEHAALLRSDKRKLASIAGTIRDDRGAPIASARVCAVATELRDSACVPSDVHGQYAIENLSAGHYQISAMAPEFAIECSGPVRFSLLATEQRRGVDIVLHRGGLPISGLISDASGGAIAHARVRLDEPWGRTGHPSVEVEADEHGYYVAWSAAQSVGVTAIADGYAPATRYGTPPSEVDLSLTIESTLSGTVVEAGTATPVADVTVALRGDNGTGESVVTDEQGHFTVDRLTPGRYTAIAHAPHGTGQANGSTELALGEHADGVTVQLYPAQQVTGHIFADGKPCESPTLNLVEESKNLQPDVAVDPDGTLHADGVLPGTYIVTPWCEGFVRDDKYEPIVVSDHDVTATWSVHAGISVTGRVRSANGAPVPFAEVSAQSADIPSRKATTYAADHASADGEYVLHGLRPGKYQLFAVRPSPINVYGSFIDSHVDITATGDLTKDLVIPDLGGSINGVVTTSDRKSPGRVTVIARVGEDGNSTIVTSDDAGRFVIPDLAVATYDLTARAAADHGSNENLSLVPTKISVIAGQPVEAKLVVDLPTGVITGRVVDGVGQPVTDAFIGVALESDDAPAIRQARSDNDEILVHADGTFVADHLGKGPFTVRASRKGAGEAFVEHVPPGNTITIEMKQTGEISGVVHRSGPIDDLHVTVFDRDTEERVRDESFFRTDGHYAITGIPAGHYRVAATTGGAAKTSMLDLGEGEHATLDISLEGMVTLVGHVVDARDHRPIAGISMVANLTGVSLPYLIPDDQRNRSDDAGRFEIPNVPRGELDVSGSSFDNNDKIFSPVGTHRAIGPSDPDVIDIGNIALVVTTRGSHGESGLLFDFSGEPRVARVGTVEPNSAAAEAGIYVGDVITAIDGVDLSGADAGRVRDLLDGDVGTAIHVTLDRGDTVTLVLGTP